MREENEMEFSGVYHKTSEQMSYALDEDRLIVNIKTGYDVKQVFIHYGDPYEAGILGGKEKWIGKREEMIYKKRLPYQIWWTTTLLPEYKRCKYYSSCGRKRKSGIILKMVSDRRTAPDGWPYAAVLYCPLDEPGRYQSYTGMGKRKRSGIRFSRIGSATSGHRKRRR